VILLGMMLFSMFLLSGCVEENNKEETNNDQDYENKILGTWIRNETYENFTFIIVYKFFSNQSFFSGVRDEGVDFYNVSVWGDYIIDSEEVQFIVGGDTSSSSTHKYFLSPEEDLLLLYYEDGINYDVLEKET
jgi:hypothetical protein